MGSTESGFESDVREGERFQFGKNWASFLSNLTVIQIKLAESSLRNFLQVERLDGKSFLDIGSGSGLFSLAARRLGANVHSFDYDPQSVACTMELRRRYFPNDSNWIVQRGSVLDLEFLEKIGKFDIVYSWGVLHHTGSMWQALDNVKSLVPIGGQLFIAIYNDQGAITDRWARVKKRYNALPGSIAFLYALGIIASSELRQLADHYRHGSTDEWLKTWTNYHNISARGMSRWHDWIDWIGGYPYERATLEQVAEVFARDGFRLTKIFDCSSGYGCNEFVFHREASQGNYIEAQLPNSRSMAKRCGRRVIGPFELAPEGWTGKLQETIEIPPGTSLYLIRNDKIVGRAVVLPNNRTVVAAADEAAQHVNNQAYYVVAAHQRLLHPPFLRVRGQMWQKLAPDLEALADRMDDGRRSAVFVFEDGRQLPEPHSLHDDIDRGGKGRFSHWGDSVFFSSTDRSDPNEGKHRYCLMVADQPIPNYRSMAIVFGHAVIAPFELTPAGWTGVVQDFEPSASVKNLVLVRNDELIGNAELDATGRVVVAAREHAGEAVLHSGYRVVRAEQRQLEGPFQHERGLMWSKPCSELRRLADDVGKTNSPVFLFQNGWQLPCPHAAHDDIANLGSGRFSHWNDEIYFSTIDGADPNSKNLRFDLLIPKASR